MASTSKQPASVPVKGILKTSKHDPHADVKTKKKRKLPPWMASKTGAKRGCGNGDVSTLPLMTIPPTCSIVYSFKENDCNLLCDDLLASKSEETAVGFDIEWPVNYSANPAKTAVIQICNEPEKQCFVFHISCMGRLPLALKAIIEREDILKVGLNIEGDMYKLCRDFDIVYPKNGVLELNDYANTVLRSSENWSLARLVKFLFGRELPKDPGIRKSKWDSFPLSEEQKKYAALDAIASIMVYNELEGRKNVTGVKLV